MTVYCYHQNDFCIKMGRDESHFDESLSVPRGKVTTQERNVNQVFKRKENRSGIEPRSFCLPALSLSQTNRITRRAR